LDFPARPDPSPLRGGVLGRNLSAHSGGDSGMRGFVRALASVTVCGAIMAGPLPVASQTITNPDWLRKPSLDAYQSVWPADALRHGRGGRAVISCDVTESGVLDSCVVVSEDPPGEGFGYAALLLAPRFLMKPATLDGKPVRSSVRIPITWGEYRAGGRTLSAPAYTPSPPERAPLSRVPGEKPAPPRRARDGAVKMLVNPLWIAAPTHAEVDAAWPKGALKAVTAGHATVRCRLTDDGHLRDCDAETEDPSGMGFAKAAVGLTAGFRAPVSEADAASLPEIWVTFPVHFLRPGSAPSDDIKKPRWVRVISPEALDALYPDAARKSGVRTGLGVADCAVGANGVLSDCKPGREDPAGLGFADAAVRAAPAMQMSAWTDGGSAVDGGRIHLPIRLTLPDESPAQAPPASKP
jgi:TonB family protein